MVRHDSGSDWEVRQKASTLGNELVAQLPTNLVDEAEARRRELNLWETAVSLLEIDKSAN
ncbi:MAG: hypothetical protein AAF614_28925 [Chloroflexota bacterium]